MNTVFLRLLHHEDKSAALASAAEALRAGTRLREVFAVKPESFGQVPGSPFAYWVSERVRRLFTELPSLVSDGRDAQFGASTKHDFRFVRAWWEVAAGTSARSREETQSGKRWVPFAKGGAYSPYYSDLEVVIDWEDDGRQLKESISEYRGSRGWGYQWTAALNGYKHYFRPGLVWSRRSQRGFSVRVLPKGCIFGEKGPAILVKGDVANRLLSDLAVMNSPVFIFLLHLKISFGSYEVGAVEDMPVPSVDAGVQREQVTTCRLILDLQHGAASLNELNHHFRTPGFFKRAGATIKEMTRSLQEGLLSLKSQNDRAHASLTNIAFSVYGLGVEDRRLIEDSDANHSAPDDAAQVENADEIEDDKLEGQLNIEDRAFTEDGMSYCVGSAFGRWDVRTTTGESHRSEPPDPFAPLPVCSPGMLTRTDGLPATETPSSYPLRVEWDGIMVDDPDHPSDIVRRLREVLELLWKDRADAIEKEACEILGVKEIRDYFRKPGSGGFWDDHVKRYSKSRRKAPIYWLLQSGKKNYALWVYYHRLDKDILFKALVNYVEPKVRLEDERLTGLRTRRGGASGREVKTLDRQIEKQEAFVSELRDFEDKLRRAANLHLVPDLNDGVLLNIAPLWELVPWKEAKGYWDELLAGEYEWSSIGKQLREKRLVQ